MNRIYALVILVFTLSKSFGQDYPLTPDVWDVQGQGHVFEMYKGKQSLYLYRGRANLKTPVDFLTGIIEYDIFVTDRRGFPGVHFRVQDDINFEEFYIRPHQSGNPDANQYTPVFNGLTGWQLYYGPEFAAPVNYKMNAWNHIKLVIAQSDAEVYINDMQTPALYIPELKRAPQSGTIRISGGGPSPFHFADLKVTKMSNPTLKSKKRKAPILESELIKSWTVSNSFPESVVDNIFNLKAGSKANLTWAELPVESAGYANLARVAVRSPEKNTVFAKVVITSDRKQIKKLSYGFSDRVKIFLNDEIIAGGNDGFSSRDYRFLGTMGYFDDVFLPLKKGENELWIAVSESFGGWGIMARFEDKEGIKVD